MRVRLSLLYPFLVQRRDATTAHKYTMFVIIILFQKLQIKLFITLALLTDYYVIGYVFCYYIKS